MKARHALLALLLVSPAAAKKKEPAVPVSPPAASTAAAAVSPEMEAEVKRLLVLTGAEEAAAQMEAGMMAQFNATLGQFGMPEDKLGEAVADVKLELEKLVPKERQERIIIEAYARHMALDDVKAVNAFYASPAGRRVIKATPQVMKESMERTGALMQSAMKDVFRALAKKYPELQALLPEEPEPQDGAPKEAPPPAKAEKAR
jgi:hypothetical protein